MRSSLVCEVGTTLVISQVDSPFCHHQLSFSFLAILSSKYRESTAGCAAAAVFVQWRDRRISKLRTAAVLLFLVWLTKLKDSRLDQKQIYLTTRLV